jgi:hypothetical protein
LPAIISGGRIPESGESKPGKTGQAEIREADPLEGQPLLLQTE